MTQKISSYLFVFTLLIIAVFLRVFQPGHIAINFDQVQILQAAQNIVQGDFALIGPRTGPATMFTGPLIYYLTATPMIFFDQLNSLIVTIAFLSLLTGSVFYFLTKYYLGQKIALISLTIWAFSPLLILLDRTLWNPNLTFLAAILILIPLLNPKKDKITLISLFLGGFLTYQAHFSGFLLAVLGIITILFFRYSKKLLLPLLLGLACSLLPTFVFDLRNQWLNTLGLWEFFVPKENGTSLNFLSYPLELLNNFFNLFVSYGRILFNSTPDVLTFLVGLFFLIFAYLKLPKHKIFKLFSLWSILTICFFVFYQGNKPEYYYLFLFPIFILLIAYLFASIKSAQKYLLALLWMIFAIIITIGNHWHESGFTINSIRSIQKIIQDNPVSHIYYDTQFGSDYGIRYFLDDINLQPGAPKLHIALPTEYLGDSSIQLNNNVSVWFDQRSDDHNYLVAPTYYLTVPKSYFILQNPNPETFEPESLASYSLLKNSIAFAQIDVIESKYIQEKDLAWAQACLGPEALQATQFTYSPAQNSYYLVQGKYCYRLLIDNAYNLDLTDFDFAVY